MSVILSLDKSLKGPILVNITKKILLFFLSFTLVLLKQYFLIT